MLDGRVFIEASPLHEAFDAVAAEAVNDIVFEGDIETGAAGVTLPSGAAAELVIDASGFMAFGADDMHAAKLDDLVVLLLPFFFVTLGRIATEYDVNTAPSHVGGDGDGAYASCLGDDISFLFMVFGVEHLVRYALSFEYVA
jgi:hypothetical protein